MTYVRVHIRTLVLPEETLRNDLAVMLIIRASFFGDSQVTKLTTNQLEFIQPESLEPFH